MATEEIKVLIEEEMEPVNILIEEIGHGTGASIFDHRDIEYDINTDEFKIFIE